MSTAQVVNVGLWTWVVILVLLVLLKVLAVGMVAGWSWWTVLAPVWGPWLLVALVVLANILVGKE